MYFRLNRRDSLKDVTGFAASPALQPEQQCFTVFSAIASREYFAAEPRCGKIVQRFDCRSGWPIGRGSGFVTSIPAEAIVSPLSSACASALLSTSPPRPMFTKQEPFFILAKACFT